MRRCCVTGQRYEKKELLRVVRTPEGKVIYDKSGKANGRGAYVLKSAKAIEKARKTKIFNKHLNETVPDTVFEELLEAIINE